jgi:hypothetical protein
LIDGKVAKVRPRASWLIITMVFAQERRGSAARQGAAGR